MIRNIERLAGERFREVGLAMVADDEPGTVEELAEYATAGRSWVALDSSGHPIGYVLVDVVDRHAHIEQVSVLPDHQGRGVCGALLDQVDDWARRHGHLAVTLTTYAGVSWNSPLYAHLGFQAMDENDNGPELVRVRREEAARGLDVEPRICLRRDVGLGSAPACE